jgi:hypothetical protein
VFRAATVVLAIFAVGCTNVGSYATDPDQRYAGVVIGNNEGCDSGTDCSFIRRGFAVGTSLTMSFDPDQAAIESGRLTTSGEPCGATFADEPMFVITPLVHDSLSQYEFPGSGRIQNFIYTMHPTTGPLAGRDPMVFASMMRDGGIELRVIAGSGRALCAPDDCTALATGTCDFFGIFRMRREDVP